MVSSVRYSEKSRGNEIIKGQRPFPKGHKKKKKRIICLNKQNVSQLKGFPKLRTKNSSALKREERGCKKSCDRVLRLLLPRFFKGNLGQ